MLHGLYYILAGWIGPHHLGPVLSSIPTYARVTAGMRIRAVLMVPTRRAEAVAGPRTTNLIADLLGAVSSHFSSPEQSSSEPHAAPSQ